MNLITACWGYCRARIRTTVKTETGASLAEYGLLVALIAVICIAAITLIGEETKESFSSSADAFTP